MKQKNTNPKILLTVLTLGAISTSQAQWLQHSNVVTGLSTSSTFIGGTGAYTGTVNSSISNVIDGMGNGVPGIVAGGQALLTPTYNSLYPTNPSGQLAFLNVTGNDSGDSYKVTMDFTGLGSGYLPSGTLIGFLDVDIQEQLERLVAFDTSANQYTSAWLSPTSIAPFDYDMSDGLDSINPGLAATVTSTAGAYQFTGDPANQTAVFQGFNTTQNITRMEWTMRRPIGQLVAGGYGYGVAIKSQPVPEPASCAALTLGAIGIITRRRASRMSR